MRVTALEADRFPGLNRDAGCADKSPTSVKGDPVTNGR
jgi:hypothetical protein